VHYRATIPEMTARHVVVDLLASGQVVRMKAGLLVTRPLASEGENRREGASDSASRGLVGRSGGRQGPVGRATPEAPLDLRGVLPEQAPSHAAVARLELAGPDVLGEIGGLREEVVDAKARGEARLERPRRGGVAGGHEGERGAGPVGQEIAEREPAADAFLRTSRATPVRPGRPP